jgi:hypothetical protein
MAKLLNEIKYDLNFIKSHTLQPQWYKILKLFILIGFLVGYCYLFGLVRTAIFTAAFFSLSLLVHLLYRIKTDKFQRSWLDFVVSEKNGEKRPTSIGMYYYTAVILNAILAVIISQLVS